MLVLCDVLGLRGLALLALLVLAAVLLALFALLLVVEVERSSPMSSESSRSCTASPNRRWSSTRCSSRSRSRPARSSINGRHSSTSFFAAGGGAWPVSRSRTIMATRVLDRRIGAVGDLVELAAMEAVVEHRGEIARHAHHAARADRLDARLLDRLEHRARLLAARHEPAVHRRIVTGELERDRHRHGRARSRHPAGELARRLGQPRLAAGEARPLGGEGRLRARASRDRAQAAGDRALERLGRATSLVEALGLMLRHRLRRHQLSATFTERFRQLVPKQR